MKRRDFLTLVGATMAWPPLRLTEDGSDTRCAVLCELPPHPTALFILVNGCRVMIHQGNVEASRVTVVVPMTAAHCCISTEEVPYEPVA